MESLFIGHAYIDVTMLADSIPTGDEKMVARDYAVSFGGNAVTAGFACARLGHPVDLLTSVARIPSVLTSTISGNALGLEKYGLAISVFAATAIVSVAGILLYRRAQKKRALKEAGDALANVPLAEYPAEPHKEPEEKP